MKRIMAPFAMTLLVCISPAFATIINIPADYPTIQQGIDASSDGDTVLVQPGTYVENINFNGQNIVLGSLFFTTGDTTYIADTVIDGDSAGSVVTFENGEDSTALLAGFTLIRGFRRYVGGGILCANSSPRIVRNTMTHNVAWFYPFEEFGDGGAIACLSGSAPVISSNKIIGNTALFRGGGIYCEYSSPIISNNIIQENGVEAGPGGGGIACVYSNPLILNNIICDNSTGSSGSGGGILCTHFSSPSIMNNVIYMNSSGWPGSALDCYPSSAPFLINSVIWNNFAYHGDRQVGGEPTVQFSDIQGGWEGEGNIDVDPLFRDPENGDFHLMSMACGDPYDSPCIDAGHPDILDSLLDCSWGLGGIRSDMGAYGGGDSVTVGIDDLVDLLPRKLTLFQNYPNPFNPATTITFALPEASQVRIQIYNILGQRVATLLEDHKSAGTHNLIWNGDDFPSGVYFARLESRRQSQSIKMVLLK